MPVFTKHAPDQFSWVDYSAHDAAATTFYGEVFGWKAEKQDTQGGPPYWIFKKGDHEVAGLGQMDDQMRHTALPRRGTTTSPSPIAPRRRNCASNTESPSSYPR